MSNDALMAEVLRAVQKLNMLIERDPLDLVTEAEKRGFGKIRTYEIKAEQTEEIAEKATYVHVGCDADLPKYKNFKGDFATCFKIVFGPDRFAGNPVRMGEQYDPMRHSIV